MAKKKFKSKLQSFLMFLIGPTLIAWVTWAFASAKGGLVLFSSLVIIVGFLYISSPNRLVIDKYNNVEGIVNKLRLYAQGRRFLYNQLDRAEAIINSSGYSGRSISLIMEEVEDQLEALQRSSGISDDLSHSDILRREADRIERRETEEYIERLRQRRVEECNIIIPNIQARIKVTGPSFTHWILIGCFLLALTFLAALLYPKSFKSILDGPDNHENDGLERDPDAWLTDDPKSGGVATHYFRSIAKMRKKNYLGAIEDLSYGIEKYPDLGMLYQSRGLAKQLDKDFAGALTDYDKAIELNDLLDVDSYYYRASINYELHNYDEALKDLDKVIINSPEHYSAYHLRGLTKIRLNDREGALRDLQEASRMDFKPAKEILRQMTQR